MTTPWQTSTDPAAMLRAHPGASLDDLRYFVLACREVADPTTEAWHMSLVSQGVLEEAVGYWLRSNRWDELVPLPLRAALLRCCVPGPGAPVRCRQTGNPLGTDTVVVRADGSLAGCDCACITPQAVALAREAVPVAEACTECDGEGGRVELVSGSNFSGGRHAWVDCSACKGTGYKPPPPYLLEGVLPVVADALEDGGCPEGVVCGRCKGDGRAVGVFASASDPDFMDPCPACSGTGRIPNPLLQHLRSAGPHSRHCHAVRLILGE